MRLTVLSVICIIVAYSIFQESFFTQERKTEIDSMIIRENELNFDKPASTISQIPLPKGYKRVNVESGSFAEWLRNLELKKDKQLLLYNKQLSKHQTWPYGILKISVPADGLQQCADAIMRLRAEYYFSKKEFDKIIFGNKKFKSACSDCESKECFQNYLSQVFSSCGTYTLEEMSVPRENFRNIRPTDLLMRSGSPGHAMMVADVAYNSASGQKIYLLLQSYMPSEEIYIVRNPNHLNLGPWFSIDSSDVILTPGYKFVKENLRFWK